jgi:hypothetical protein
MNDVVWKSFVKTAMEKSAVVGAAIYGGLSLLGMGGRSKELQGNFKNNSIQRGREMQNLKLSPSTAYQFEGGKKIGLNQTRTPHRF